MPDINPYVSGAISNLTPRGEGGGLFTLITCTYNASSVLQRTLDSVLAQTYPDIEHIIIDGKSSDDTVRMAEAYKLRSDEAKNGHRVVIISEPDNGLYDAMNKGISMAMGDYLCFLNAGDQLFSAITIADIARSVRNKKEVAVIYGETDIVDDNNNFLRHRRLQAPDTLTSDSFRDGMLVCHQAFYANTRLAKRLPYNLSYRLSADFDWCIRILKAGEQKGLATLNTRRILCRYLAGGMSIKNHRASLLERFRIMAHHYGLFATIARHIWFVWRAVIKK